MPLILSGLKAREAGVTKLAERVKKLSAIPKLAIIQVGDRPDSTAYIKAKKEFARKIGVETVHLHLPILTTQEMIIESIEKFNKDSSIQGIVVQVPLPDHIDRMTVIESIDSKKDVDGLTSANYNKLLSGDSTGIIPATARGVQELFAHYSIPLKGKKVAVVGRSRLVGTPIAVLCKKGGADVIVCHSKTQDLAHETKQADIIVVAVGKPNLIGAGHVKKGAIVIDVGISKMPDGILIGDVDYEAVRDIVGAISPVPGGVGPMTVSALFENVVDACTM